MDIEDLNVKLEVIKKKSKNLDAVKEAVSQFEQDHASKEAHNNNITDSIANQAPTMGDCNACLQAYPP